MKLQNSREAGYTDQSLVEGEFGYRWLCAGEIFTEETEYTYGNNYLWNDKNFTWVKGINYRSPVFPGRNWAVCRVKLKWWEPQA